MFGIGGWELLVIVAVALMVLGPRRLPAAARSIGKGLQSLRRATIDLRRSIELDPEMEDLPQTLDEINRPLVSTGTLLGTTGRRRPRADQDFGGGPPPPPVKRAAGPDQGGAGADAAEGERPEGAAAEEPSAGAADPPAAEAVERTTTRRGASPAGDDEPSTGDDGQADQGS